jgi:quercetin dioxygenase-like cupin family protein
MFSTVVWSGLLVFAMSGALQDPGTIDATRIKVELDNPQVRVLRVTLGPKEKTQPAEYRARVAVFLTDGPQRVGPGGRDQYSRADAVLLPPGKHAVENLGPTPSEIVLIEFKTAPIQPWKGVAIDPVEVDPNNFKVLAENEYARVLRASSKPPKIEHEHGAYMFVWLSGDGLVPGVVKYEKGPARHAPQNNGDNVMVELKTHQPPK